MAEFDYGKIISRSFEITRKNKWLWVMGLALAIFGGGGGSGGGSSPSSPGSLLKNITSNASSDFPQKANQVLGASTDLFKEWFSNISPTTWILIGTGIFIVIIIWIAVSMIIKAWAGSALIYGIDRADCNEEVSLLSSSPKGIAKVKHMVIFSLLSLVITFSVIFTSIILFVIGAVIFRALGVEIFWYIAGGLSFLLVNIFLILITGILSIYAERLIVLYNYTPWEAWKKGLSLSRGNFLPTIIMGILNSAIGCSIGCLSTAVILLVIGIPAIILLIPVFNRNSHLPTLPSIIGLGVLLLIFIYSCCL